MLGASEPGGDNSLANSSKPVNSLLESGLYYEKGRRWVGHNFIC